MSPIEGWWALPTPRQIKASGDLQRFIAAYFSGIQPQMLASTTVL
jgi:hypothetical protein